MSRPKLNENAFFIPTNWKPPQGELMAPVEDADLPESMPDLMALIKAHPLYRFWAIDRSEDPPACPCPYHAPSHRPTAEEKKLLKAFSNNSESPQTRWIEIERCRILEIPREIFNDEYEKLNENGQKILGMERPELIRRAKDGKLFKVARYMPMIWQTTIIEFERSAIYLEEV